MKFVKCPRCEINYMSADDEMCTICSRELKGGAAVFETVEMCSECGENPALPGKELCAACLKEFSRNNTESEETEEIVASAAELTELDSMSGMDEIVPDTQDLVEDLPEDDFDDEADDFEDEEEEE